jgi:hypothetical protein
VTSSVSERSGIPATGDLAKAQPREVRMLPLQKGAHQDFIDAGILRERRLRSVDRQLCQEAGALPYQRAGQRWVRMIRISFRAGS